MKQCIAFALVLVMLMACFSSCSRSSSELDNGSSKEMQQEDIKITEIHPDWAYYDSVQLLAEAATDIYEGEIVNISFDIIDIRTGQSISGLKNNDKSYLELYTIYEIEVLKSYKGTKKEKRSICVIGGLKEYKLIDQYNLMSSAQIYTPDTGIKVIDEFRTLKIGESYLFLTADLGGTYDYIVNSEQFAFGTIDTGTSEEFNYHKVKDFVKSDYS